MHVHTKIALFLLTAIACAAMGCKSESTPRSTLELTMETRNDREKLIVPEGSSLEISKYLVNGKSSDQECREQRGVPLHRPYPCSFTVC